MRDLSIVRVAKASAFRYFFALSPPYKSLPCRRGRERSRAYRRRRWYRRRGRCSSATRPPTASRRWRSARRSNAAAQHAGFRRRDVAPGENYQEAIVGRSATRRRWSCLLRRREQQRRDQEGALARQPLPRAGHRAEDRGRRAERRLRLRTVDAPVDRRLRGWDKSIDSLVSRIGQISGAEPVAGSGCRSRSPPLGLSLAASDGDCGRRRLARAGVGRRRLVVASTGTRRPRTA